MTRLLKPLLQTATQPILMTMMPNVTPPPSSASQPSPSARLASPPAATRCSLHGADSHSLLDRGDAEGVDLPGCLLPTPHSPKRPRPPSSASPRLPSRPSGAAVESPTRPDLPSPEEALPDGVLHSSSSNGMYLQDRPPLASPPPSPSLSFSMSLCSSLSLSPCKGPHLLPPPPSQDTPPPPPPPLPPPPPSSHCSAPPSLTSSPGDRRQRPPLSIPLASPPAAPLHPPAVSLPSSLDFVSGRRRQRDTQNAPWWNSQLHHGEDRPAVCPQELELHEWGRQVEEGKSSAEHISFIDEEEPAL